jgi:predicted transcriptional regulator
MSYKNRVFRCYRIVKINIPAVRYALSVILYKKHRFNQQRISIVLGITQPAVSKYINRNCSAEIIKAGEGVASMGIADKIAKKIAENSRNDVELKALLDKLALDLYQK